MADLNGQVAAYMRLLYSGEYAGRVEAEVAASAGSGRHLPGFVASIDFRQLEVERRFRIASLRVALGRTLPSTFDILGETAARELVEAFADSDAFWVRSGRSLAENLCLFASGRFEAEGWYFLADLCRLEGALSGETERPGSPSPWGRSEDLPLLDAVAVEAFLARFPLLHPGGAFPTQADYQQLAARPAPHLAAIFRHAGGDLVVRTVSLEEVSS